MYEQIFMKFVYPNLLLNFAENTMNTDIGITVASKIHEFVFLSTCYPLFLKYERK